MKWSEVEPYLAPSSLHLIVMPTEKCNLRCTYCYEDFALERMPSETVRGLLRLLERRAPGLQRLSLEWFGGEPLLAAEIVEQVQERALRLAERHPAMMFHGSMTTNAVLLDPQRLTGLVDLGVTRYQITLDGLREHHDQKRIHAGGQRTFDRIWRHLLAARGVGREFEILVRVHVDHDNLPTMPRFLDEYEEAFGDDSRFNLWFRPLSCFGGPNDGELRVLELQSDDPRIRQLRRRAAESGLHRVSKSWQENVCYASYGNAFVVRADGTLGKCTIVLSNPKNTVGRLLPDGKVRVDASKMKPWLRGLFSRDKEELGCPMRGFADDPFV